MFVIIKLIQIQMKQCTHTHNYWCKKIFSSLLISFFWIAFSYSQNLDKSFQVTPNGVLENVFDQSGRQYWLSDLLIGNRPAAPDNCSSVSYFNLIFEEGCGMENISNPVHNARRAVVCKVFEDLSNFINSPLSITGNKVNIWIRNINNVYTNSGGTPSPNGILGTASSFYCLPRNSTIGGIADSEIWKTIHTGQDSYLNITAPLTELGGGTNQSGMFYHGMLTFNFNDTDSQTPNTDAILWNTNLTTTTIPSDEYDLYSAVLHEITHALGFVSLINSNGKTKFNNVYFNYYSRYDTFLKTNDLSKFIITPNFIDCSLYDYELNNALDSTVLHPNPLSLGCIDTTVCSDAIQFTGTSTVPVYTPNCFNPISSLSHFEDTHYPTCNTTLLGYGNDNYFLMCNGVDKGVIRRFLKPEERNTLCDIGYSVKTTFGSASTINGIFDYGGISCDGITVARVNDGIDGSGGYAFFGDVSTDITINGNEILFNDPNAINFECLEDITDTVANPTSLSTISGNNSTNIIFNSAIAGLHLLRYVPTNGSQKGNITYIYVYVNPNITTCTTEEITCNLVRNGRFEANSVNITQQQDFYFNNVCDWQPRGYFDYYYLRNFTTPTFSMPCNNYGSQNDNVATNNAYAGILCYSFNPGNSVTQTSGILATRLVSVLNANTTYQLKFDVSQGDFIRFRNYQLQAFISSLPPNSITSGIITNPQLSTGILVSNATVSSNVNGWDTITLTFTTSTTQTDLEYLYLGILNNPLSTIGTTPQVVTGCTQSHFFFPENGSVYYIDNVLLLATSSLNLPQNSCANLPLNLTQYLTTEPSNGTFSWSLNGGAFTTITGTTFTPTTAGTYTINYSYNNNVGCPVTISDTITVTMCNNPVTPTFTQIAAICSGGSLSLPTTSIEGITGTWAPAINNSATTQYTFTPAVGQNATTSTMTVTVNPKPAVSINSPTVCAGQTATLTATPTTTGTYNYVWTAPATITNPGNVASFTTTVAGQYSVTITDTATGCASDTTTGMVMVNTAPVITITGPTATCPGNNTTLTPSVSAGTWTWVATPSTILSTNPTINSSTRAITFNATATGTITFTYSVTQNGCTTAVSTTITVGTLTGTLAFTTPRDAVDSGFDINIICLDSNFNGTTNIAVPLPNALTLSVTQSGGQWISSQPTVVTIDSNGTISALATGVSLISYTLCGVTIYRKIIVKIRPKFQVPERTFTYCHSNSINVVLSASIIGYDIYAVEPGTGALLPANCSWTCSDPASCVTATGTLAATGTGNIPSFATRNTSTTDKIVTFVFTGYGGGCVSQNILTITIIIKPIRVITFDNLPNPIKLCRGSAPYTLPLTSLEGYAGVWIYTGTTALASGIIPTTSMGYPTVQEINTDTSGTYFYYFVPNNINYLDVCYTPKPVKITAVIGVANIIKPWFSDFSHLNSNIVSYTYTLCPNSSFSLPTTSNYSYFINSSGIPSFINTQLNGVWHFGAANGLVKTSITQPGNYYFVPIPNPDQCGVTITLAVSQEQPFTAAADGPYTISTGYLFPFGGILNNDQQGTTYLTNTASISPYTLTFSYNGQAGLPAGFTYNNNGTFSIDSTVTVGQYTINYTLTSVLCPNNTSTTTVTIIVVGGISTPPKNEFAFCFNNTQAQNSGNNTGGALSFYDGSTVDGNPATGAGTNPNAQVLIVDASGNATSLPTGWTLDQATGSLTIPPGTLPQSILIYFKICPIGSTIGCGPIRVWHVTIQSPLRGEDDQVYYNENGTQVLPIGNYGEYTTTTNPYNVLDNDHLYNCATGSLTQATVTNVTFTPPPNNAANPFNINNNGAVNYDYNISVSAGEIYILQYTIALTYTGSPAVTITETHTVTITIPYITQIQRLATTNNSIATTPVTKNGAQNKNTQYVYIPDASLKNVLLTSNACCTDLNHNGLIVDADGNGEIDFIEAANVEQIGAQVGYSDGNISDLTGLHDFVNLKALSVVGNQVTQLNSALLPNSIIALQLWNNPMTIVETSNLPNLVRLYTRNTLISTLDLGTNHSLTTLTTKNCPNLVSINIKNGIDQEFTSSNAVIQDCWQNCPNLTNVCVDASELTAVQDYLTNCGGNASIVNSNCAMGVENAVANSFTIAPNPSSGVFTVTFGATTQPLAVEVYDVMGRKVYNNPLGSSQLAVGSLSADENAHQIQLDLTNYPSGEYFVTIKTETGTMKQTIIKK